MNVHLIPQWFFGYHVFFQIIFFLMTTFVAKYSLKVYRLTKQKQAKLFGLGFAFFALHYLIQSILNSLRTFNLIEHSNFLIYGTYCHAFIFLLGIITIAYMTLKTNNKGTFALLTILSIISIYSATNTLNMFYVLSSVLLTFICIFYFKNYMKKRKVNSALSLIAFTFLLFGSIHFLISVNHEIYYVIAHFLELISYGLIILNLKLIENEKKKK